VKVIFDYKFVDKNQFVAKRVEESQRNHSPLSVNFSLWVVVLYESRSRPKPSVTTLCGNKFADLFQTGGFRRIELVLLRALDFLCGNDLLCVALHDSDNKMCCNQIPGKLFSLPLLVQRTLETLRTLESCLEVAQLGRP
jgi:hypothetical protein